MELFGYDISTPDGQDKAAEKIAEIFTTMLDNRISEARVKILTDQIEITDKISKLQDQVIALGSILKEHLETHNG